jgi:hypothetical protein
MSLISSKQNIFNTILAINSRMESAIEPIKKPGIGRDIKSHTVRSTVTITSAMLGEEIVYGERGVGGELLLGPCLPLDGVAGAGEF